MAKNWTGHEDMRPNAQSGKSDGPTASSEKSPPRGANWKGENDMRPSSTSGKASS